jgi:hypothetical protein
MIGVWNEPPISPTSSNWNPRAILTRQMRSASDEAGIYKHSQYCTYKNVSMLARGQGIAMQRR